MRKSVDASNALEEDCKANGINRNGILNSLKLFIFPPRIFQYLKLMRKIESIKRDGKQTLIKTLIVRIYIRRLYKIGRILSFEIPPNTCGAGLCLPHGGGIIINSYARIGDNVTIRPFTVIGNKKSGAKNHAPVIGNNVDIGCNCCIIGNVHIGNNVVIGAGSVVVSDLPDNSICVGNPAKVIKVK